jgi:hypothetical protein
VAFFLTIIPFKETETGKGRLVLFEVGAELGIMAMAFEELTHR